MTRDHLSLAAVATNDVLPDQMALDARKLAWLQGVGSLLGPVPRVLERYAPPAAVEAARMVEARFGLFFELAREDHEEPEGGV